MGQRHQDRQASLVELPEYAGKLTEVILLGNLLCGPPAKAKAMVRKLKVPSWSGPSQPEDSKAPKRTIPMIKPTYRDGYSVKDAIS